MGFLVCHSLLQWTTFCQTSPPWPVHLGLPHMAWLGFIELDKAVVHVIRLVSFLWLWFSVYLLSNEKDKRLTKASRWARLRGILGLVQKGGVMLSRSLILFSVDGWGCAPSLLFTWGQTMVEVMKMMVTSLKRSHACTATVLILQQPTTDPCLRRRLPDTHRQVSCGVTVPFPWVLVHKVLLCPPSVCFPVLCKFWQLYGGVNGDLLQEDLCHNHTQSPCPCGRPLPTRTSTGDTQTQFCLSLWGPWFLVCTRFVWALWVSLEGMGFDLKANSHVLPSCWGFSFAFGCGVSPHSGSSAYHLTGVSLTLDVGYLLMAAAPDLGHGVSPLSRSLLQCCAATARHDSLYWQRRQEYTMGQRQSLQ